MCGRRRPFSLDQLGGGGGGGGGGGVECMKSFRRLKSKKNMSVER